MVDYLSEVECYHMFAYFDRDKDGFLDYEDFLQIVLPTANPDLRAKTAQREPYDVGGERL